MEKENLINIWPILYFKAVWPAESYKFDLGVQIIKADESILQNERIWHNDRLNDFGRDIDGFFNFAKNTDWLLVMHRIEVDEHISVNEIDMSLIDRLQQAIKESFLLSLQLIRSTEAICPFKFLGNLCEDHIEDMYNPDEDFSNESEELPNSYRPLVYLPETFEIGDLQLLTDLWLAIIKLRKLDSLKSKTEEFFAACDKEASENALKELVDIYTRSGYFTDVSEEERKSREESIKKLITTGEVDGFLKKLVITGDADGFLWDFYKDNFLKAFEKQKVFLQKELFSNRTRIGRALNLFFEGLRLPLLHSFLSMCLVLETIFTVEDTEITYQFSTRLANIIGKNLDERKEIFKRARKLYTNRSYLVHGRKSIETVEQNILKDSFFFARKSLQYILLNDTLLELYSNPITSDNIKDTDKAIKAIKNYFRDLDLRCY